MSEREEYEALKKNLLHHRQLYDLGQTELEDYEYDQLMLKLKSIEAAHPNWIEADSPSQIVELEDALADVDHDAPMLSINDVFSTEEVVKFVGDVQKKFPSAQFLVEEKVDGVSAAMRYRNGSLERVISRGNGRKGRDITQNARLMIENLIEKIEGAPNYLELRGEIFIGRKQFDRINADQIERGLEPFANPRNCTAGLMNSKRSESSARLSFVVHGLMRVEGRAFETHSELYRFLESNGVEVIHDYKICSTAEEILAAIETIGESRAKLDRALDGAVIKLDNLAQRAELGVTAKAPRWSIAYKFPPEVKRSIVREIELNVGRTGRITPVAIFDPIELAGTTVSRATLHNRNFIEDRDIRIGSTVEVYKSGEIIPKIKRVVGNPEDSAPYRFIEDCPSCGSKLEADDWRCLNPNCPAQIEARLVYFAGKNALDIEGLGKANVRKLLESGLVKSIADLFTLEREELIKRCGFGPKETDNLLAAIEKSKKAAAARVLTGLGIEGIGEIEAEGLLEQAGSIERIGNASLKQLNEWISDAMQQGSKNIRAVFDELARGEDANLIKLLTTIEEVDKRLAERLVKQFGSIETIREASLPELYWIVTYNNAPQNIRNFFDLLDDGDANPLELLRLTKLKKASLLGSIDSIQKLSLIKDVGEKTVKRLEESCGSFDAIRNASINQIVEWIAHPGLKNIRDFFALPDDPIELLTKIKKIDRSTAEKLLDRFGSLDEIMNASLNELNRFMPREKILKTARNVREFFDLEENKILINRLEGLGLNIGEQTVEKKSGGTRGVRTSSAGGKTIVFTGALTITRDEAARLASAKGFAVRNSITGKTDYVVVGEKPGSKLTKAQQLGITILNEEEFRAMIDGE